MLAVCVCVDPIISPDEDCASRWLMTVDLFIYMAGGGESESAAN